MVDIQDEFPFESTTEDIKRQLLQIRKARGQKNYDVEMLLGQFELQSRATARTGKVALAVAGAALLVSIISGGFAAYYAHAAFQSSQRWEQRQLATLETLQNDGAAIRDTLRQVIDKVDALQSAMATTRGNGARKSRR